MATCRLACPLPPRHVRFLLNLIDCFSRGYGVHAGGRFGGRSNGFGLPPPHYPEMIHLSPPIRTYFQRNGQPTSSPMFSQAASRGPPGWRPEYAPPPPPGAFYSSHQRPYGPPSLGGPVPQPQRPIGPHGLMYGAQPQPGPGLVSCSGKSV